MPPVVLLGLPRPIRVEALSRACVTLIHTVYIEPDINAVMLMQQTQQAAVKAVQKPQPAGGCVLEPGLPSTGTSGRNLITSPGGVFPLPTFRGY